MSAVSPISIDKAKEIAKKKGIRPCIVKGTKDAVQLTKGSNPKLEVISWSDFELILKKKGLVICEAQGFMRLCKK